MDISGKNMGLSLSLPKRERLSHAYILISPASRKAELAARLAAHMLCSSGGDEPCLSCQSCRKVLAGIHPDVITIERPTDDKGKPKREVVVSQIRALLADSVVLPNEASYKVYVILDAEYMNSQAQNALLKLLEEPPEKVRFILCAENPGSFLDTIRSRCIELTARAQETGSHQEDHRRYLELAAAGDRLGLLKFCLEMEEISPAQLEEFIQGARLLAGSILTGRESINGLSARELMEINALLARCLEYLQVNVSAKQVLGLMSVGTIG